MRGVRILLSVMVVVLSATLADGGTIKNFINTLPVPHDEHFNDFSWEQVIDNDGDGFVTIGDFLEGVFNMESVGVEGGTLGVDRLSVGRTDAAEVTGHFRVQVMNVVPVGGVLWDLTLGPEPSFGSQYGPGAMAVAYEGTGATQNFDATQPIPQVIADATDGLHLVTLGFTGAPGEGWRAAVATNSIAQAQLFGSAAFGFFQANLNRILSAGLANDLSSLPIVPSQQSPFLPGAATEFSLNGQLYGTRPGGASFPMSNSAEVFFAVVPEPSTLVGLLTAAMALVACAWARRKR